MIKRTLVTAFLSIAGAKILVTVIAAIMTPILVRILALAGTASTRR